MALLTATTSPSPLLRTPVPVTPRRTRLLRGLLGLGCMLVLIWAYQGAEIRPYDLYAYRANMLQYAKGFLSPNFVNWPDYLNEMIVTVQIAIWGTLLAVLGAIPCGLLSSANIAPVWLHQPVRRCMDAASEGDLRNAYYQDRDQQLATHGETAVATAAARISTIGHFLGQPADA